VESPLIQSGNVYVDDQYNHRIQKFSSTGAFITKWGTLAQEMGSFIILLEWQLMHQETSMWQTGAITASRRSPQRAPSSRHGGALAQETGSLIIPGE